MPGITVVWTPFKTLLRIRQEFPGSTKKGVADSLSSGP